MKKILRVLTLAITGLALSTSIATASTYKHVGGENPCLFGLSNLKSHGYVESNSYTTEQIQALLKASDIEAHNVETLVAAQNYQLSYSCYVDHQLAHSTLQALPVNSTTGVITNITWSATKPA